MEGLQEVITFIDQNQQDEYVEQSEELIESEGLEVKVLEEVSFSKDYTKLEFDDLNS